MKITEKTIMYIVLIIFSLCAVAVNANAKGADKKKDLEPKFAVEYNGKIEHLGKSVPLKIKARKSFDKVRPPTSNVEPL